MKSVILTNQHLSVIGAALRFWYEENADDQELLQIYSDVTAKDLPSLDDVRWIVENIAGFELRYLICANPGLQPSSDQLFRSPEAARQEATGIDEIVVTVMVPKAA